MWTVLETAAAKKALAKAPKEIEQKYRAWILIVQTQGPQGLRLVKGFHDEALAGQWDGFRSSRLNLKWRVIYSVRAATVTVTVKDVNAHDYRR